MSLIAVMKDKIQEKRDPNVLDSGSEGQHPRKKVAKCPSLSTVE